ncbi:hypothetical protein PsorP6_009346 [Peronosclerospora sorghi]|uniref:Uncharacterized protein n=1 Tax=Peronosclerospora sorghi TaxID=230839 RepID=A0ACC0W0S9_9STRA|nr:hypothetical protein PsorP6_009346 [Peronosclerospora sorghi]
MTLTEMDIDRLDHVVCQIPEALALVPAMQEELLNQLKIACDSYGFTLPSLNESIPLLEELVDNTLTPLSDQFGRFASLQLLQHICISIFPLPKHLLELCKARKMLLIGDGTLEALLSSGKPFRLKSYHTNTDQDIALLLMTASNLALAMEKKYV